MDKVINIYAGKNVTIMAARLSLFAPPPASRAQARLVEEMAVRAVTSAFNAWFYNA